MRCGALSTEGKLNFMAKKKSEENDESNEIVKFLIKEMNKGLTEPVAWSLTEPNPTDVKEFISTGSTILDYIISNRRGGGIPVGKLTEIVGEEASGKSLLCSHIIANTQKKGGIAIYLDTENAANPDFMKRLGVNIEKLVYLQPGSIEECYEAIEKTITMARAKDTKCPVTIIWDSTAATPPMAEIEGDYDPNSRIGLAAKAHAKGMRKLTKTVGYDKITLIFTNHLKVKIGVMFGDPMTTPGGKAVPYHASVRVRLTRSKELKHEEEKVKETIGIHTYAKVFKNRLGPPMRSCAFDIMFADGVDDDSSIRDFLWERGSIEKASGWMKMNDASGKELKFRATDWSTMMQDDSFKEHVFSLLDKHLIVNYDNMDPKQFDIDEDSLLDMESIVEEVA